MDSQGDALERLAVQVSLSTSPLVGGVWLAACLATSPNLLQTPNPGGPATPRVPHELILLPTLHPCCGLKLDFTPRGVFPDPSSEQGALGLLSESHPPHPSGDTLQLSNACLFPALDSEL